MSYEQEFINHLSKEIETHTNAMMTYRTRIAFIVFLGPFILLGSVVVGSQRAPYIAGFSSCTIIAAAVFLFFCYIVLGLVSGMIERGMWRQCNRWRAQIAALVARGDVDARGESVQFSYKRLLLTYGIAFGLFFLSFIVMIFLISTLF